MKGQTMQRISAHMRIHNYILPNGYEDYGTQKRQLSIHTMFGNDLVLMMLDDYVGLSEKAELIDG